MRGLTGVKESWYKMWQERVAEEVQRSRRLGHMMLEEEHLSC